MLRGPLRSRLCRRRAEREGAQHPMEARMIQANVRIPTPVNEPVLAYSAGSPERAQLKEALQRMAGERIQLPLLLGGKHVRTARLLDVRLPHPHAHLLAAPH